LENENKHKVERPSKTDIKERVWRVDTHNRNVMV